MSKKTVDINKLRQAAFFKGGFLIIDPGITNMTGLAIKIVKEVGT